MISFFGFFVGKKKEIDQILLEKENLKKERKNFLEELKRIKEEINCPVMDSKKKREIAENKQKEEEARYATLLASKKYAAMEIESNVSAFAGVPAPKVEKKEEERVLEPEKWGV